MVDAAVLPDPKEGAAVFANRTDAGVRLANRLRGLEGEDAVILALPRGGVPVAFEVAKALRAPLDVIIVRKLGVPSSASWAWAPSPRTGCASSTTA